MNVLLIDDDRDVNELVMGVRASLGIVFNLDWVRHIPEDLAELDKYDILIVDNAGIGNNEYPSGKEFLLQYGNTEAGRRHRIVHFSSFVTGETYKALKDIGIEAVTKSWCDTEPIQYTLRELLTRR